MKVLAVIASLFLVSQAQAAMTCVKATGKEFKGSYILLKRDGVQVDYVNYKNRIDLQTEGLEICNAVVNGCVSTNQTLVLPAEHDGLSPIVARKIILLGKNSATNRTYANVEACQDRAIDEAIEEMEDARDIKLDAETQARGNAASERMSEYQARHQRAGTKL